MDFRTSHALIIGIDDYKNGIRPLATPEGAGCSILLPAILATWVLTIVARRFPLSQSQLGYSILLRDNLAKIGPLLHQIGLQRLINGNETRAAWMCTTRTASRRAEGQDWHPTHLVLTQKRFLIREEILSIVWEERLEDMLLIYPIMVNCLLMTSYRFAKVYRIMALH